LVQASYRIAVFRVRNVRAVHRFIACDRLTGRRTLLRDDQLNHSTLDGLTLNQAFAAYLIANNPGGGPDSQSLALYNVRTGQHRISPPTHGEIIDDPPALDASGVAVYLMIGDPGTERRIVAFGLRGSAVLARSPTIDPSSVAVAHGKAYWTAAGDVHAAALPADLS
jgi:hypothetical protein